jgi:hypothetical protein
MSEAGDITARTQRFNAAARAFTPPAPTRHAKLMPMKDGIVELRQKGASLRLIRELLATVDVFVGTDTIARFLAEVTGESQPARLRKRPRPQRAAAPRGAHGDSPAPTGGNGASSPRQTPIADSAVERPRTRGPRVADPRNL